MDADPVDERIGRLVDDRYRILEAMASGAMGAVYKAERVPVGKIVAIKFLHKSYAKDSEFLTRFERETRAMSKLAHPNCVSVVDFGVWEEAPYLVMDYVAGTTLRAIMDHEEVVPLRALALGKQIAAGLAHAHAQGIVHRDIKPANIMISDEIGAGEHVRLLDFGLARLRGGGARDATQTNVVVGTPNYMAPEQTVPGMTIDARADVYSLGVVLFEMLAGERPFSAPDTLSLLGMHRAAPIPRLADKFQDASVLPAGTQELVDTAMAKSPDDRYQSAVDLASALEAVIGGGRPATPMAQSQSAPLRKNSDSTTAIAPTMVSEAEADGGPTHHDHKWSRPLLSVAILLLGIGGGVLYLMSRHSGETVPDAAVVATNPVDAAVAPPAIDAAIAPPVDASELAAAADAAEVVADDGALAAIGDAAPDDAVAVAVADDAGAGSAGSEIELDPESATDPDPHPNTTATDPEDNAPSTADEADKKPPSPPPQQLAETVAEAVQLIKDGKHDQALHSLRALWKKSPSSSYIPFLLGNLYYDQLWWGVAMDCYASAISQNSAYKNNATLNHNVIRMLGSAKTKDTASAFIKKTIGHAAVQYLKGATKDDNGAVRKQAQALLKQMR